jgi:hypothetical protein
MDFDKVRQSPMDFEKEDTVLWPGSRFVAHQSLEAWEFQNLKLLAGLSA